MKVPTPVELTRQLVRMNTVNPPGDEHACALYLAGILEAAGFRIEFVPMGAGRSNLVATLDGAGDRAAICLSGHLDTVPLGGAPWSRDPFSGECYDGKIYGRGSSDMKSGVAAIVVSACHMAARGKPGAAIVLAFTAGEETGCDGAACLAESGGLPERAGALIVAEPTSNYPLLGHKGALWLEGTARGVTAHGSMPERGVNAIYKAARAALRLEAFDFGLPEHPILGRPTVNVGTISGGLNVNSVPDLVRIGIDLRSIPGLDHDALLVRVGKTLGAEIDLKSTLDASWVWTDPGEPWVGEAFSLITPFLGETPEPRSVSYFTDASVLRAALGNPPTLILGPGEAALAHQTDEYCRIDRVEQAADIFETLMSRWCEG